MQHRLMTDSDVFADAERVARVGVQYRTVLNVAALTYFDVFVVTAQLGHRRAFDRQFLAVLTTAEHEPGAAGRRGQRGVRLEHLLLAGIGQP